MNNIEDLYNFPDDPLKQQAYLQSQNLVPMLAAPEPEVLPPLRPPTGGEGYHAGTLAGFGENAGLLPMKPAMPDVGRPMPMHPATEAAAAPDLGAAAPAPGGESLAAPIKLPELSHKEKMELPLMSPGVGGVGSSGFTEAELARAQEQKEHPWGRPENHPGFWGKFGHVLGRIGNIALDVAAPTVAMNIPGTDLYKQMEEQGLKRELAARTEAESRQRERESEGRLREAQTEALLHPERALGKTPEELTLHDLMTGGENGTPRINPDTKKPYNYLEAYTAIQEGKLASKPQKENLEQALTGSIQDALNAGRDPKSDPKVQAWKDALQNYKPTKEVNAVEEVKRQLSDALDKGDITEVRRLQAKLKSLDPEGAERLALAQFTASSAAAAREAAKAEREEKADIQYVTGTLPDGTGRTVMVPQSQARAMGLVDVAKADDDHVKKTIASRVVSKMLYNTDPNSPYGPGALQMIDQLEKNGDLGVLASRWNEFMARTMGADTSKDQLYTRLRTWIDLAQTKLMQAHVGARGGADLLEHFEDLAKVKKLNAQTLRAAIDQELRYVYGNSEAVPSGAAHAGPLRKRGGEAGGGTKAGGGHSFTYNGQRFENVPDELYQKYKQRPGFQE